MTDIHEKVEALCRRARAAAPALQKASGEVRNRALAAFSAGLRGSSGEILAENEKDLTAAAAAGLSDAMLDRLRLTKERIDGIADGIEALILLEDPIGAGSVTTRPNGLEIKRIRVPLGVVGVIFESRPNVSADIAALCLKSGNAAVLRGGKEAICSNLAIVRVAREALASCGLPADGVILLDFTDRAGAQALMDMRGLVDVLIPRGSKNLISTVVDNAKIPVIETGAGNCHLYIHADADIETAVSVAVNGKTSRPSVCNALETILVNESIAPTVLPLLAKELRARNVELRCCPKTLALIGGVPASEEDWSTEYDDLIAAVKTVDSLDAAINHINCYTTGHSEAIITESRSAAARFCTEIDAACVYVNASTRFTDGGCFGFGAEVGISTQKLHARGPMGLQALTTEKYIINGNGQIR